MPWYGKHSVCGSKVDSSTISTVSRGGVIALSKADGEKSWVAYVIAASVLATAFGNMFVMRSRLKSISRWKAPSKQRATSGWEHPSPSNWYKNDHVRKENLRGPNTPPGVHAAYEPYPEAGSKAFKNKDSPLQRQRLFLEKFKKWKASEYDGALRPDFVPGSDFAENHLFRNHLRTLRLPLEVVPSPKEVKEAYRLIALELHPDSNNNGKEEVDPAKAQLNRATFTDASNAAKALHQKLSHIEKSIV